MNCFKQNNTKFYELTCKTTAGFIVVLSWQCMCKSKMHIIPLDSSAVTFSSVVSTHWYTLSEFSGLEWQAPHQLYLPKQDQPSQQCLSWFLAVHHLQLVESEGQTCPPYVQQLSLIDLHQLFQPEWCHNQLPRKVEWLHLYCDSHHLKEKNWDHQN